MDRENEKAPAMRGPGPKKTTCVLYIKHDDGVI
jgi:hypothetical protein